MSLVETRRYLEKLFPGRLGLTKEEADFHTQGMAYAVEPQDGIYLFADVAEVIERSNGGGHKPKGTKHDVKVRYTKQLSDVWVHLGYA